MPGTGNPDLIWGSGPSRYSHNEEDLPRARYWIGTDGGSSIVGLLWLSNQVSVAGTDLNVSLFLSLLSRLLCCRVRRVGGWVQVCVGGWAFVCACLHASAHARVFFGGGRGAGLFRGSQKSRVYPEMPPKLPGDMPRVKSQVSQEISGLPRDDCQKTRGCSFGVFSSLSPLYTIP